MPESGPLPEGFSTVYGIGLAVFRQSTGGLSQDQVVKSKRLANAWTHEPTRHDAMKFVKVSGRLSHLSIQHCS